ncbi:hypothetical protein CARUB_v10015113mg [Capsella rubella]|uniref:Low-density receptor-like protein n=1 Tax=Capsella rubella TaxID=81985 RepID=R0I1V4_9BRAS|nr:uncharacterized protein LOC17892722 [Capsella rubella]EOA31885.1 hypothetical protein CARUB_v10015113mg [Capsella rubella]
MASFVAAPTSFSGDSLVKAHRLSSTNFNAIRKSSTLTVKTQSNRSRKLSISAGYRDGSKGGGSSDFVTGFLLGSAVFGTLAYIFAPQIRRSVLNENEHGFKKPQQPMYYDEGLEERREILNEKIGQLNSAIDNVSSRLRSGGSKNSSSSQSVTVETDAEAEATA